MKPRLMILRIAFTQILICFLLWINSAWSIEEDFGQEFSHQAHNELERLQIYFETEMYEEASSLLEQLIAQFPEDSRFEYLQAIVDYQRGDYGGAEKVFLKFIEQYPQVAEPYYLLAQINLKMGDEDMARQYLNKYCQLVPEDYDAHHKLSSISSKNIFATGIIKDGRENLILVEKVGFYGACVHNKQKESIKLINGSFGTWSSMGIDFSYPVDLRGKQIVLKLKGKQGGENFELTFRDKFAADYNPQLVLAPEKGASSDWQYVKLSFAGQKQDKIDLSQVVHMGLEFGSSTVRNPAQSTLFVKDIFIEDVDY